MRIFKTLHWKLSILSVLLALTISVWRVDAAFIRGPTNYLVGVGISDVTGPAADVNMMGYTMLSQKVKGIHLRLRSRAYIVVDQNTGKRNVFASVDICMASTPVRRLTLTKLSEKFGDMYNDLNVAISGTHTHAGPAGFLQYTSFQILSSGYVKENTETIASGIFDSIVRAHESLQPGNIYVASGDLADANTNRSPYAYDNNPQVEKDQYKTNTDTEMVLLKFTTTDGKVLGSVNWFPVHCTSMYNNNTYISGDNKGYAGYLMEKTFNGPDTLPGTGSVHAFAQSNMGDVSPNTLGAFCEDTGEPCEYKTSTCNGKNELCQGRGPGWTVSDFESTRIIGERQAKKAMELLDNAVTPVTGSVDYRHQFINMPEYSFELNGNNVTLCKAAMGYSFAAGTTDGPGAFDFKQGDNSTGNAFWNFVRGAIKKPSAELVKCQDPKPILLATGETTFPYAWGPAITDVQVLKIGNFVILAVPGEFTTMAGRRLRKAAKETLVKNGVIGDDGIVVLAGPANEYTHYVTTFEEYTIQRYEGASTIYGPNTLDAYINIYNDLSKSFADGITPNPGDPPPDLTGKAITLLAAVIVDVPPIGKKFGDILQNVDANSTFTPGQQVSIQFVTGNPRNNHFRDDSFMYVQKLDESNGQWVNVRTDGDWSTRYSWLDNSKASVTWEIEPETVAGKYKIVYQGSNKLLTGKIEKHSGESLEFFVEKS